AEADDRGDESEQVSRSSQHYLPFTAFVVLGRGLHGAGFTFTRLPLTVWYFGFGFLSGQSGSFFLALTPGFVPDETLVEVVVVDFGVVPGATGAAAGWAGGTGGIPLGRIGVPV